MSAGRRWRTVLIATAMVLGMAVGAPAASAAGGASWSQYRAAGDRRGWNRADTTLSPANVTKLWASWRLTTTGGPREPVIVGRKLLRVMADGTVIATDITSGAELGRSAPALVSPGSALAAVGDKLYFVQTGSALGDLAGIFALDVATLRLSWSWAPPANVPFTGFGLATEGNTLVAMLSMDGDINGQLWRVVFANASSHAVKTFDVLSPVTTDGGTPAIKNGIAYFLLGGKLRAYTSSGLVAGWTNPTAVNPDEAAIGYPVAASDLVYVAAHDGLRAFNPSTGKLKWRVQPPVTPGAPRRVWCPYAIAVDDTKVYLSYGDECVEPEVFLQLGALNRFTGQRAWIKSYVEPQYPYAVSVANGIVYVAETVAGVAAYRATNGVELWRGLRQSWTTQLFFYDVAVSQGTVVARGEQYDSTVSTSVGVLVGFTGT
jgi:hypothetical protein